jgi:hypothetical protein
VDGGSKTTDPDRCRDQVRVQHFGDNAWEGRFCKVGDRVLKRVTSRSLLCS